MNETLPSTRNLVFCFDGTGNQFGANNSNVVKLYRIARRDTSQLTFYDPGVGTLSDPNVVGSITRRLKYLWSKIKGLAIGYGILENVEDAYRFLMDNYQEGDRLYVYGFSRGAYTAKVFAALIYKIGILEKGYVNLIPYGLKLFEKSYQEAKRNITSEFKLTYSRDADIHFMGLWDSVSAFGMFNKKRLPNTTNNSILRTVRHAVSVDEKRTYFSTNLFGHYFKARQNFKEVWFAGVHSDVGGSYDENQNGLSKIALEWMLSESIAHGLTVRNNLIQELVYAKNRINYARPNHLDTIHQSLKGFWWIIEFFPRRNFYTGMYIPFGRSRELKNMIADEDGKMIPGEVTIHESLVKRLQDTTANYKPTNLPAKYQIESWRALEV